MIKHMYITLPKLSSYQYKDNLTKKAMKDEILKVLDWCEQNEFVIHCFLEDALAVTLLHDKKVKWHSLISTADRRFLLTFVEDFPEQYKLLEYTSVPEDTIKLACKKYKTKTLAECNNDEVEFLNTRLNALRQRIKFAADKVIQDKKCILHFKDGNTFVKEVKPIPGDGKLIINWDLIFNLATYHYGGVAIEKELIEGGIML